MVHFKLKKYFSYIYAIDSGDFSFSDKTEAIATLLHEAKINPGNAVYIGDREEDFYAATQNKVKCILVDWGYEKEDINLSKKREKIRSIYDLIPIL